MVTVKDYGLVFIVSMVLSGAITPVTIKFANKIGAFTVPDDGRRMHARNIPRLGGFALYVASIITLLMFAGVYDKIHVIIIGGTLMYALGLIDDIWELKAWVKLIAQLVIIILMYAMGIRIDFIQNYFGPGTMNFNEIGNFIISILWMLGITNAINLIDGLDGLAAGTVCIDALCMTYISYLINGAGRVTVCIGMMALAGACMGFLPFNFSPAKTFMGDGGSLFLGFMFAALSTVGRLKSPTVITMILPIIVLALPVFDTGFAVIRRMANHKSVMDADQGHIHHNLMAAGHGHARSVLMLYCLSGVMCMAAILICRNLYYDAAVLIAIAITLIYVFLTDKTDKLLVPGDDKNNLQEPKQENNNK